ncbi:MAG: hypothetical protein ABH860_02105 [bacterium]
MAYQGVIAPSQLTERLNYVHFDIKRAMRDSQNQIKQLLADFADPDKDLIVDGVRFTPAQKYGAAASLAISDKMSKLSDTTTTMLSVFTELYKMEKALGGQT